VRNGQINENLSEEEIKSSLSVLLELTEAAKARKERKAQEQARVAAEAAAAAQAAAAAEAEAEAEAAARAAAEAAANPKPVSNKSKADTPDQSSNDVKGDPATEDEEEPKKGKVRPHAVD
jgi:hypothetical protein